MYDFFETLFISGQIGAEKPSAVYFDRCMERLPGVRPEQCLMIGDSLTADIAGGRAAGMHTCWFDPDDRGSAMAAAGGSVHHAAGTADGYSVMTAIL